MSGYVLGLVLDPRDQEEYDRRADGAEHEPPRKKAHLMKRLRKYQAEEFERTLRMVQSSVAYERIHSETNMLFGLPQVERRETTDRAEMSTTRAGESPPVTEITPVISSAPPLPSISTPIEPSEAPQTPAVVACESPEIDMYQSPSPLKEKATQSEGAVHESAPEPIPIPASPITLERSASPPTTLAVNEPEEMDASPFSPRRSSPMAAPPPPPALPQANAPPLFQTQPAAIGQQPAVQPVVQQQPVAAPQLPFQFQAQHQQAQQGGMGGVAGRRYVRASRARRNTIGGGETLTNPQGSSMHMETTFSPQPRLSTPSMGTGQSGFSNQGLFAGGSFGSGTPPQSLTPSIGGSSGNTLFQAPFGNQPAPNVPQPMQQLQQLPPQQPPVGNSFLSGSPLQGQSFPSTSPSSQFNPFPTTPMTFQAPPLAQHPAPQPAANNPSPSMQPLGGAAFSLGQHSTPLRRGRARRRPRH